MQSCHQIPQNQKQVDHKTQTNKNRNKLTQHPKCVKIGTQSAIQLFCTITTTSAVMNLSEFSHAASQLGGFRYTNEMIDECCACCNNQPVGELERTQLEGRQQRQFLIHGPALCVPMRIFSTHHLQCWCSFSSMRTVAHFNLIANSPESLSKLKLLNTNPVPDQLKIPHI
jgi:hypothetical protein